MGKAGRPPKKDHEKVNLAVRCLVSSAVYDKLLSLQEQYGLAGRDPEKVSSDTLRWAIYHLLGSTGYMSDWNDPTWGNLLEDLDEVANAYLP